MKPRLLIAGIGNIFFGDDAFGCEVARELMRRRLPDEVRVEDFGIRGYDLAYALMDGCDAILVDAVPRGEAPGTLYLIEPDTEHLDSGAAPDGHTMTPVSVLQLVHSLSGSDGVSLGRLYLVGCEPSVLDSEDGDVGLSESVEAAIPKAIEMIESLVRDLLKDGNLHRTGMAGAAKEVS